MSGHKTVVNVEYNDINIVATKKNEREAAEENTKHRTLEEKYSKVDMDTILVNEVGQFGWFQVRTLVLSAIAMLFTASASEYVFTSARINTRCLILQCEDASNAEFAAPWLASALPSSGVSFDSCLRFANTTDAVFSNHSCPAHLFDASVTQPCEEYVYENTLSVVYDFHLACKEWRRSLIGFSRTVGTFFSIPLTGFVSDRWGRRTTLALNAFNSAWLGLLRYWTDSYAYFVALEILEAIFSGGITSCAFILALETVGPEYRTIAGGIITSCHSLGLIFLGLIAWAIPDWRRFTLAIYIPQLFTLSYFWILTESVRWYLSKGRYEETEVLLKKMARINKKELSEKSLQLLRVAVEENAKKKAIEEDTTAQEPWLPILVFRHKPILIRCMLLPVCWITMTLIYHGLSIMSVNISGHKYINYVVVSAVEIPGFWIAVCLTSRVGRKSVLIPAYWLCAICQAAYIFIPSGNYTLSLCVYLVGKCSIAAVATAIYLYTTELFPTRYRHSLFAFSSMMGRIGSITAPLTPAMSAATFEEMPFVLFGSFALVSGLLVLLTPETLGTKLPDTLEEADNIIKKQQTASYKL